MDKLWQYQLIRTAIRLSTSELLFRDVLVTMTGLPGNGGLLAYLIFKFAISRQHYSTFHTWRMSSLDLSVRKVSITASICYLNILYLWLKYEIVLPVY